MKKPSMTGEQFRKARSKLGLTQRQMATVLRTDIRQVQRWESGDTKITGPTSLAVELLLELHSDDLGKRYGI
jgi:DNA-binding transcriptional regulator YiaG